MKHGKILAVVALVAALLGGASTAAVAEHDADTKAGQRCAVAEHGMFLSVTYEDGSRHDLVCARNGQVWQWKDMSPEEKRAREKAAAARKAAQEAARRAAEVKEKARKAAEQARLDGEVVVVTPGLTG